MTPTSLILLLNHMTAVTVDVVDLTALSETFLFSQR